MLCSSFSHSTPLPCSEGTNSWNRPVLVNVSSLKIIITFFAASNVTTWLVQDGPIRLFAVFAEMLIVISMGIPILFFTGKRLRQLTGAKVRSKDAEKLSRKDSNHSSNY